MQDRYPPQTYPAQTFAEFVTARNPQGDSSEPGMLDSFIPYVRIPLEDQRSLFLGNDAFRDHLQKAVQTGQYDGSLDTVAYHVNSAAQELVESFGQGGISVCQQPLEHVGLLVSVNAQAQFSYIDHKDGPKHYYAPIDENKVALHEAIYRTILGGNDRSEYLEPFVNLFQTMDATLDEKKKDIFLHCNQGEHRSAAIAVMYVLHRFHIKSPCEGTRPTFADAHAFVKKYRTIIKPLEDRRKTVMTEFFRLSKELPLAPQGGTLVSASTAVLTCTCT
jgi:hypothetical protein